MVLLDRLNIYADQFGERLAFQNVYCGENFLTYEKLKLYSDRMADYLTRKLEDDGKPVIVYGHKQSMMLVSFLACVKAHHPYCPVDISMPEERIKDIAALSGADLMIAVSDCDITSIQKITNAELSKICQTDRRIDLCTDRYTDGEDTFYVIFTSGSTGRPKGVEITANCLDHFLAWSSGLAKKGKTDQAHDVFLNQELLSFDLSVMDIYTSLYTAGTIWALDRGIQTNMGNMFRAMENESKLTVWVSTPSFINMTLMVNKKFNAQTMPDLHTFLFCGEVLTNKTVQELQARFPEAAIINTYGPTEATVAVTSVVIDREMADAKEPLSIGETKPGTEIYILDENYALPEKEQGGKGEIIICGDTVAKGYLNETDLTEEKFFVLDTPNGAVRAYKTGDMGYKAGKLLYYSERKDFQLKINGYRIETGDVESNLLQLEHILDCAVIPVEKRGKVKGLAAFILMAESVEDELECSRKIREYLIEKIPDYMVPKEYRFLDEMPMTNNGKTDRLALKRML